MVLTVTLNPLLERNLHFKDLSSNNRAFKEFYTSGGKGINISRQLNLLGVLNQSLIFLGGNKGKILRSILEKENINFTVVSSKSETREATLIFDEKNQKLDTYFGINSDITLSEVSQFIQKLEKAIFNSSIVVFSGSFPNSECFAIFEKGIKLCNQYDKISVLDSYDIRLDELIKLGPKIIHNNVNELEKYLKVNLTEPKNYQNLLHNFYENGTSLAFITNGKNSTYASKADFHYRIDSSEIVEKNPTGSGDAFLAGIIYGLENSLIFNDFAKFASALGTLNAENLEVCNVDLNKALKFSSQISIHEIGKKIKLIDDSPTIY
jgi:tagatose 6-phosphate kinase